MKRHYAREQPIEGMPSNHHKTVEHLLLTHEGLKTTLDYIQLREAREFSAQSLNRSNIAIIVSIVSIILAIVSTVVGFFVTTKIDFSVESKVYLKSLMKNLCDLSNRE